MQRLRRRSIGDHVVLDVQRDVGAGLAQIVYRVAHKQHQYREREKGWCKKLTSVRLRAVEALLLARKQDKFKSVLEGDTLLLDDA